MHLAPVHVNANHTSRHGRSALHEAIAYCLPDIAKTIIAFLPEAVDVDIFTPMLDQSALVYASEKGHIAIADWLVGLGSGRVKPDSKGYRNMTPLLWAATEGRHEIVKLRVGL